MSDLKRVLLVSRSLTPPWDEASKNFARVLALRNEASQMTVLTDGHVDEFPARVKQVPIYSRPRLSWGQRLRLLRLRGARNRFDVVHYLFTPTATNSMLFRTLLSGGSARSVQTVASLNGKDYTAKQVRQLLFADRIITYSDFSRVRLEQLGCARVETIHPGINLDLFANRPRDPELAAALGIPDDAFVVMYPGEYVRLGATDSLVAVLPRLLEAIPNLTLVFGNRVKNAADNEKKAEVIETIRAAGLSDHVVFTDTVRDMPALYNLADVVLFPVENMVGKFDVPLAVIEAMACEKPIVISNLPVLAEFTSDTTTVVIGPGDRDALVGAVVRLHADPVLRATIGREAREYARSAFDIEDVAARYEAVYESLARRR